MAKSKQPKAVAWGFEYEHRTVGCKRWHTYCISRGTRIQATAAACEVARFVNNRSVGPVRALVFR